MPNFIKVWACQRLGLGEISGTVVFPRYLSWPLERMGVKESKSVLK